MAGKQGCSTFLKFGPGPVELGEKSINIGPSILGKLDAA